MKRNPGVNARTHMSQATEIIASGYAYPSEVVDNDTFFARCRFPIAEGPGGREALVRETGMKTRYWCAEGENTWTMAKQAIAMALSTGGLTAADIDVVLVASCSTMPTISYPNPKNRYMTDLAPWVLAELGRDDAIGFDIKGVYCSGFIRGLQVMDALLENPNYRTGLLVATEQGGNISITETNRSPFCFQFSDSAGAVVLRKSAPGPRKGLVDYEGYTRASLKDAMTWGPDGQSCIVKGKVSGPAGMEMLLDCGRRLLARNGLGPGDVDWLLPAQLDARTVNALCDGMELPREKLVWRGDVTGYAASASIPTCLAEHLHNGAVKRGELVLSMAVGSGMNCGAALYYA